MRCERVAPGRSGISFAEALVRELDDSPVSVTALMPGPTETSFFHRAGMQDTLVAVSRSPYPSVVVSPDQTEPGRRQSDRWVAPATTASDCRQ